MDTWFGTFTLLTGDGWMERMGHTLREGFTKKVAVLLDFVQMTPLQGEQGDENFCVLCKVIIFSHGFQAGS